MLNEDTLQIEGRGRRRRKGRVRERMVGRRKKETFFFYLFLSLPPIIVSPFLSSSTPCFLIFHEHPFPLLLYFSFFYIFLLLLLVFFINFHILLLVILFLLLLLVLFLCLNLQYLMNCFSLHFPSDISSFFRQKIVTTFWRCCKIFTRKFCFHQETLEHFYPMISLIFLLITRKNMQKCWQIWRSHILMKKCTLWVKQY